MKTIAISVRDKIAINMSNIPYTCGNSDFVINFDFDAEWDEFSVKTARFIKDDRTYQNQVFQGNKCPIPVLYNTNKIRVGVFAGNLHTSTPAIIPANKGILCVGGSPEAPSEDVYAQIMEMLNNSGAVGGGGGLVVVYDTGDGTANYSPDEIKEFFRSGNNVVFFGDEVDDAIVYQLRFLDPGTVIFEAIAGSSETAIYYRHIYVQQDKKIYYGRADVPINSKTSQLENDIGFISAPATAAVGQTIVVSEVDAEGKPTKWEVRDAGAGGGENLDLFYGALIRRKANPREPLAIKTYPGGLDQPTHPKVLYFPSGWNGHKYWMTYTPYPNNNNFEENPCITYSDDGEVWCEAGIANPIIRSEHRGSFYSDPHLVYVPDTNTMELWVRWCSNGSDGMAYGWEGVYRLKSTDGVNWSEKEYLFNVVDPSWASVLSPVAIYDEGKYKIWYCYKRECLKYYESEDGTNWVHIRDISENLTPIGQYKLWHFDIIKTNKGYEFVGCYQLNGAFDRNNYIAYSWSADNEGYTPAVCILDNGASGQFDDLELYRPSLVKIGNKYRVYYGAQKNIRIWHIGLVEAPAIELLHELLRVNTTGTLPTYSGGGDTGGGEDTEATLSSISATYSGGDVTAGTPVAALSGIIVTAYYSDGTSSVVTDYTLSGEIAEGSNTVVVSYGGLTTTITVTGVAGYDEPKEIVINNRFNYSTMNQTGFYDANSGEFTEHETYYSSDFIPVEPGDNIEFNGVSAAYFDANRNYVSGIPYSSTTPKTATVPDGVVYISFAFSKTATKLLYLLVLPVKEADIAIGEDVATSANIDRTGYYDNGVFRTDSTYGTVKMTNVSPGMVFTGANVNTASFYDSSKTFFYEQLNVWTWPVTVPKQAVYMTVSFDKSKTPSVVRKE